MQHYTILHKRHIFVKYTHKLINTFTHAFRQLPAFFFDPNSFILSRIAASSALISLISSRFRLFSSSSFCRFCSWVSSSSPSPFSPSFAQLPMPRSVVPLHRRAAELRKVRVVLRVGPDRCQAVSAFQIGLAPPSISPDSNYANASPHSSLPTLLSVPF